MDYHQEIVMHKEIRKSSERGFVDHGWLKTYHTFSFGEYYDPHFMGFRTLRVINEDRIKGAQGFPTHSHDNMEILTLLLEGELANKDIMGNGSVIHAGEAQLMSAGSGITHSEFNHSATKDAHLLQIWILPDTKGLTPGYQQKQLSLTPNQWVLVASKQGLHGSLRIHQDAEVSLAQLEAGHSLDRMLKEERYGWLHIISGTVNCDGAVLQKGDAMAMEGKKHFHLTATSSAKILFFDLN